MSEATFAPRSEIDIRESEADDTMPMGQRRMLFQTALKKIKIISKMVCNCKKVIYLCIPVQK